MRLTSYFQGALRGIAVLARGLFRALLLVALIAASAAVVVVPAWLLASRRPRLFTALTVVLLSAGVVVLAGLGLRRAVRSAGGLRPWLRGRLLPTAARLAATVAFLAAAYGIALLYAAGAYAVAAPTTVAYLVLLGGTIAASRRRGRAEARTDGGGDGHPA